MKLSYFTAWGAVCALGSGSRQKLVPSVKHLQEGHDENRRGRLGRILQDAVSCFTPTSLKVSSREGTESPLVYILFI